MQKNIDHDRIIRFARAEALMQRRHRTPYQTDAQVEATIRGWLRCQSVFFGTQIVLQEEIDLAIRAFRLTRGIHGRFDNSQRAMLIVA